MPHVVIMSTATDLLSCTVQFIFAQHKAVSTLEISAQNVLQSFQPRLQHMKNNQCHYYKTPSKTQMEMSLALIVFRLILMNFDGIH